MNTWRCGILGAFLWLAVAVRGESGAWQTLPDGGLRQADPTAKQAEFSCSSPGTASAWRCIVVPGFRPGAAGFRIGRAALALESREGHPSLRLRDTSSGKLLWADEFVNWQPYEGVWLELVRAGDKVYVQALTVAEKDLLSQSDWLDCHLADDAGIAVFTDAMTAEFHQRQAANKALWPQDRNSPTKMRLLQFGQADWIVKGGGDWRWTDMTHSRLRLVRVAERTTAYMTARRAPAGRWHCRLKLDKGTCGGGMMVLVDPDIKGGFVCWLGGTYGNGALMLYRNGVKALWSSAQGKWHWDTEYVLEAEISDGMISTRLLAADGKTVITASPKKPLSDTERSRPAMTGFQVWRGTGTFWDFSEGTQVQGGVAISPGTTPSKNDAREVARQMVGTWHWIDARGKILEKIQENVPPANHAGGLRASGKGEHRILLPHIRGARGLFSVDVQTEADTQSVALLFQVGDDGKLGFECRLGQGCELRTMAGKILWRDPDFSLTKGTLYHIEGNVMTDRIVARVLDGNGKKRFESVDCYVPEANNERVGAMGLATTGPALFMRRKFTP